MHEVELNNSILASRFEKAHLVSRALRRDTHELLGSDSARFELTFRNGEFGALLFHKVGVAEHRTVGSTNDNLTLSIVAGGIEGRGLERARDVTGEAVRGLALGVEAVKDLHGGAVTRGRGSDIGAIVA